MVVEREAPRSPSKDIHHSSISQSSQLRVPGHAIAQPTFGQTSPLRNALQPKHRHIFNIPKANKPRPEHHIQPQQGKLKHDPNVKDTSRPPNASQGLTQSRPPPVQYKNNAFKIPTNAPKAAFIAGPPPTFAAVNTYPAHLPSRSTYHTTQSNPRPGACYGGPFDTNSFTPRVTAEKAMADIKTLLEGSIGLAAQSHPDKNPAADLLESMNKLKVSEASPAKDDSKVPGLAINLLPHQIEGLKWMCHQETGWKDRKDIAPKGGILADDMGLGKTIQSIALLLTRSRPLPSTVPSPSGAQGGTLIIAPLALIKQWESEIRSKTSDSKKLKTYVHHGPSRRKDTSHLTSFDVVITTYQVLVSEYNAYPSTNADKPAPQTGCFAVSWHRIILDEAHSIKNRKAKATLAACALSAQYRWCLSGTPMQNNLDELQSLIHFLRIRPFDDYQTWKREIVLPVSQGQGDTAMARLHGFLQVVMKRRTKDVLRNAATNMVISASSNTSISTNTSMPIASSVAASPAFRIVDREVRAITAEFASEERERYRALERSTDKSLEEMMRGGSKVNYASALVLLLRLRQACNHLDLVKSVDDGGMNEAKNAEIERLGSGDGLDDITGLLGGLTVETRSCGVCKRDLSGDEAASGMFRCAECEDGIDGKEKAGDEEDSDGDSDCVIVGHVRRKVKQIKAEEGVVGGINDASGTDGESVDTTEDESYEEDRKSVKKEPTIAASEGKSANKTALSVARSLPAKLQAKAAIRSAKISLLLPLLIRETPDHKVIIFSQFTTMLDLIEPHLQTARLAYTRYDGRMSNDRRETSLDTLRNEESCRIMLCSLRCGALGLNLTAASRVVILEPFWNPFVEEQAIDRVHRINQTKNVVVYKLTVKDTVEERILALQEKKRALADAAIEGKNTAGKLSLKDLLKLFHRDAPGRKDSRTIPPVAHRGITNPREKVGGGIPSNAGSGGANRRKEDAVYGRRW